MVTSQMCADAPVNHLVSYADLDKVGPGRYRLRGVSGEGKSAPLLALNYGMIGPRGTVSPRDTVSIDANAGQYFTDLQPTARFASFDYCFNYFQSFRDDGEALASPSNMQTSCLQLGFYLASWGMLRGSSSLLRRSAKHYEPVISTIGSIPSEVWSADAGDYTSSTIEALLDTARRLRRALTDRASDTLVTKIMLGVFGNVPALDAYFKAAFGVRALTAATLQEIDAYCRLNRDTLDQYRQPTLNFLDGMPTSRRYTRSKIVDMVFFMEGANRGVAVPE